MGQLLIICSCVSGNPYRYTQSEIFISSVTLNISNPLWEDLFTPIMSRIIIIRWQMLICCFAKTSQVVCSLSFLKCADIKFYTFLHDSCVLRKIKALDDWQIIAFCFYLHFTQLTTHSSHEQKQTQMGRTQVAALPSQ